MEQKNQGLLPSRLGSPPTPTPVSKWGLGELCSGITEKALALKYGLMSITVVGCAVAWEAQLMLRSSVSLFFGKVEKMWLVVTLNVAKEGTDKHRSCSHVLSFIGHTKVC